MKILLHINILNPLNKHPQFMPRSKEFKYTKEIFYKKVYKDDADSIYMNALKVLK